jgi:adenylate cyclase
MTNIVLEEGGIIDKFEGDAVMAEFGAPLPTNDHADKAVLTGIKMQRRLKELRKEWLSRGLPKIEARVGINTGSMVIGNMGSKQVFDYTVMGDAVNLASRLEGANKPYGTFLMISEYTLEYLTPDRFRVRLLDVIKVKGKSEAVKVYEVYGECSEEINSNDLKYYQSYQDGFKAYLNQEFSSATKLFHNCLSLKPDDLASKLMVDRIEKLDKNNLSKDWDGSVALTSK